PAPTRRAKVWRSRSTTRSGGASPTDALGVAQHLARGVVAARAHDAASGVRGRAAQVQVLHRRPVVGVAGYGSQEEKLRERHRALEDVAARKREAPLDVQRR